MDPRFELQMKMGDKEKYSKKRRKSAVVIDSLPDVPMKGIFDRISLYDLFVNLVSVSARWEVVQAEACRNRQRITLLLGGGARELHYHYLRQVDELNTLVFYELTHEAVDGLYRSLPRITSLTLAMTNVEEAEMSRVIRLIRNWAGQLTELRIIIRYSLGFLDRPTEVQTSQLLRLFAAISSLVRLKNLYFRLHGFIFPVDIDPQSLYLPVLAQLESFTFDSSDFSTPILDSVIHFFSSPNSSVKSIRMYNRNDEEGCQRLLQLPQPIAQLFPILPMNWTLNQSQLSRVCDLFNGLSEVYFFLNGEQVSLPMAVRPLRSLENLNLLSLYIVDLQSHVEAIQEQLAKPDTFLDTLPQVSDFYLHIGSKVLSHTDLASLQLEQILTNLKTMYLCGNCANCSLCHEFGPRKGRQHRYADKAHAEICTGKMLAHIGPLFPHLQVGTRFFGCE